MRSSTHSCRIDENEVAVAKLSPKPPGGSTASKDRPAEPYCVIEPRPGQQSHFGVECFEFRAGFWVVRISLVVKPYEERQSPAGIEPRTFEDGLGRDGMRGQNRRTP